MRRVKRFLSTILVIVAVALGVVLALGNPEMITLKFAFWETWSLPVFVWIFVAYVLGLSTTVLVLLIVRIRTKSTDK